MLTPGSAGPDLIDRLITKSLYFVLPVRDSLHSLSVGGLGCRRQASYTTDLALWRASSAEPCCSPPDALKVAGRWTRRTPSMARPKTYRGGARVIEDSPTRPEGYREPLRQPLEHCCGIVADQVC